MMHEEDERPPNEKPQAYHFSFTYNGCKFCLLTLLQFLLSPNAYSKDDVCKVVVSFAKDPVLVVTIEIVRYCTKMSTKKCET